ncbi:hypothetical protein QD460_18620 [Rhizobium jaguaris]|uniref:hypothetical protein n=1 Tax=Rhizobium jaguaris TaxID=1312183 RepID=UPI0013C42E2C|nr:hypothetical protein [Rhizobium jaguaris]
MRILILSVGGRQLFFFIGGRPEWSGRVARLLAIIVLFFRKLQLELQRRFCTARGLPKRLHYSQT